MTSDNKTGQEDAKLESEAERRLRAKDAKTPPVRTVEDAQRLLQERQIEQVKVEMQNEELRQAWGETEVKLERYADLYDFAPVGYLLIDKAGNIVDVNLEAANLLGQHRDALLKKPFSLFINTEDQPAFAAFLRLVDTAAAKHARQFRLLREGRTIHVLVEAAHGCSVDDAEGGESTSECRLAIIDITEQKKTEDSLRQSEAIHRSLIDNIDVGITLIDADYNIIRVNPAQANLFGKQPADFVGKKCFREFEQRGQVCEHCPGTKAMATRQPAEAESVGVREDGRRFVARIRACPWLGSDGRIEGFIELVEDITERKRIEKQIEELAVVIAAKNEELEERTMAMEAATQAKDDFLASMSHELRTPLNAIIGFSEGLLERIERHPLNDHQQSRLRAIKNSGEHLLMLVNGMLDLAKMENGKVQLSYTTFDMCLVANDVRDMAEALLKDKPEVRFLLEMEKHMPMITCDRDKVRQILINLLSNAVKNTKQGSIIVRIRRQGTSFVMEVQDTGVGIPQKYVKQVFEKFFQVPSTTDRALKGSGLGLAICRAYTELLGGKLDLESVEGQGTIVMVSLPLLPGDGYRPETQHVQELTRAKRGSGRPDAPLGTILCVEANEASMLLLTDSLTEAGHKVVATCKGEDVRRLAVEERPQLIVLDLVLPDVDGWQILHELKMDPATCRIPILIVTTIDEERLALSLGADRYLRKPVDRKRLLSAVSELLPCGGRGAPPTVTNETSATTRESTSGFPA